MESHNFYLGPVAAVLAGKSPLVDVNCQYGVGVVYFIALVIKLGLVPASAAGFATLISILIVFQYALLYSLLRLITRSVVFAAATIFLTVIVAYFGQIAFQTCWPSVGPIRFLLGYLFVACVALRGRFPHYRQHLFLLESSILGIASIWSLESFVYVVVAYLGSLVYESAHTQERPVLNSLARRLGPTLAAIAVAHAALDLVTHARSGQWPHWSHYFDYILLYSVQEFGCLPILPWSPWIAIAGVYVASIVALGYRRVTLGKKDMKMEYAVIFAMSALGVGQYTYYLGRSHPNNLFHVALPAFFVAGYWFVWVSRRPMGISRKFRSSFLYMSYVAQALLAFSCIRDVTQKFDHTWLSFLIRGQDATVVPPTPRAVDAARLIRKYASDRRRVALFTAPDVEVEAFLMTRTASVWPLAYAPQDELVPAAVNRVRAVHPELNENDVVFVDTGAPVVPARITPASDISAVDREVLEGLAKRFGFEVLESSPTGVLAVRLTAHTQP
jgi:hypothetical protein